MYLINIMKSFNFSDMDSLHASQDGISLGSPFFYEILIFVFELMFFWAS